MPGGRYVVLGLASARSPWFRSVASWSNSAAVLIMAFLGVVVWVGFRATVGNTQEKVDKTVEEIGR
jgi:hypothetical protein